MIVLKRTGSDIDWQEGRDLWWRDLIEKASPEHQPEAMNAEDPLFILYTSGSTGKPKGVLHTTGGYLSTPRPPLSMSLIITLAIFTGVPPMWVG